MSGILIHDHSTSIHLFDEVQLLVLKIIQCHGLPVQEYRGDLEVVEDLEFFLANASCQVVAMQDQQMGEPVHTFISAKHHIGGTGKEPGLKILLDDLYQRVGGVYIK